MQLYRRNRIGKVVTALLLFVCILMASLLCGCSQARLQTAVMDGDGNAMDTETLYRMPKSMTFTSAALTSEQGAQVRIEAYVYPENAANREVDYTVKWGEAPEHGSEEVTDYLTVTPESDGGRIASVVCKRHLMTIPS